ncbi:MAG: YciI family protein [Actinomycetota bacterium]|jgi:hypothetical protein
MRYLLLIYGDEKAQEQAMQGLSEEQQMTEMKVWFEYTDWLREKGYHRSGEGLEPTAAATTVRAPAGEAVVTDGPFAETKEQLGGFYLIETTNLDEAIEAAKRCPGSQHGSIELRPIMEFGDD